VKLIQGQVGVRVMAQRVGVPLGILCEDVVLIIGPHLEAVVELLCSLEPEPEFPVIAMKSGGRVELPIDSQR